MSAGLTTPAIVLRSTLYGEADRVVSLLGRSTGRIAALARGARKSARRFAGGLGLGTTGEARLKERAGADLMMLDSFDSSNARLGLGQDLGRTAHAAYVLELCDKLCAPKQPEPAIFDLLEDFLDRLENRGARAERLRVFELGLLRRLGLGPGIERCVACGTAFGPGEGARWDAARGGLTCEACGRQGLVVGPTGREALQALSLATLEQAEALELPRDVQRLCRGVIQESLQLHLPGPLRALAFIEKLAKVGGTS